MHKKNMELLFDKKLMKKICNNKHFIVMHRTSREESIGDNTFQSYWLFFNSEIADEQLKAYWKEAYTICGHDKKASWEYLDENKIIKVYGMKVLVLS